MIYAVNLSAYSVLGTAFGTALGPALGTGIQLKEDLCQVAKKTQFNSVVSTGHLSPDRELMPRKEENRKMQDAVTSLTELLAFLGGIQAHKRQSKQLLIKLLI